MSMKKRDVFKFIVISGMMVVLAFVFDLVTSKGAPHLINRASADIPFLGGDGGGDGGGGDGGGGNGSGGGGGNGCGGG